MELSSTSCKIHSYLNCSFFFPTLYFMHYFNQKWPGMLLLFYLRIYNRTSTCVKRDYQPTRIPADSPCNDRIKSYFRYTYPSLQSLVPTLSPLLVRFPSVCTSRLIRPVCLLQQLPANTSLVSRSPLPSARTI